MRVLPALDTCSRTAPPIGMEIHGRCCELWFSWRLILRNPRVRDREREREEERLVGKKEMGGREGGFLK